MQGKPEVALGVKLIPATLNRHPASLRREGVRITNHGLA
jgi:hypothetical protein